MIRKILIEQEIRGLLERARAEFSEGEQERTYFILRRLVDRLDLFLREYPNHEWSEQLAFCQDRIALYEETQREKKARGES